MPQPGRAQRSSCGGERKGTRQGAEAYNLAFAAATAPRHAPHFRHCAQMPSLRSRMAGAEGGAASRLPCMFIPELGQAPEIQKAKRGMRVVTNVVDPAKRERLANAKRRLALREATNAAGRKAVAAAMAAFLHGGVSARHMADGRKRPRKRVNEGSGRMLPKETRLAFFPARLRV